MCIDHPVRLRADLIAAVFLTPTCSFCSTCHYSLLVYLQVVSLSETGIHILPFVTSYVSCLLFPTNDPYVCSVHETPSQCPPITSEGNIHPFFYCIFSNPVGDSCFFRWTLIRPIIPIIYTILVSFSCQMIPFGIPELTNILAL